MTQVDSTTASALEQQAAFSSRCSTDINFATQAVAAVLSNNETKAAFMAGVSSMAPEVNIPGGVQLVSSTKISYNLGPIEQRLNLSVSGNPGPAPTGQLTLLSYNGSEWSGLLPQAANIVKVLPLGLLATVLIQTLFGTKAGPAILLVLLLL